MLRFIKKLLGGRPEVDVKELVAQGAIIVDVRSPREFQAGHVKGSINLPLDTLKQHLPELKKKAKPVITVCRSGARSGMGRNMLAEHGVQAYNGGPWDSLQRKLG